MQTHVFYCIFHNIIVSMLNVAQKWGRWFAFEVHVSLPLKFESLKYWTYIMAQIFIAMLILTYILMIGRIKLNGMTDKLIRLKYRSTLVIRTYFNFYRKLLFCLCLFYRKKVFFIYGTPAISEWLSFKISNFINLMFCVLVWPIFNRWL